MPLYEIETLDVTTPSFQLGQSTSDEGVVALLDYAPSIHCSSSLNLIMLVAEGDPNTVHFYRGNEIVNKLLTADSESGSSSTVNTNVAALLDEPIYSDIQQSRITFMKVDDNQGVISVGCDDGSWRAWRNNPTECDPWRYGQLSAPICNIEFSSFSNPCNTVAILTSDGICHVFQNLNTSYTADDTIVEPQDSEGSDPDPQRTLDCYVPISQLIQQQLEQQFESEQSVTVTEQSLSSLIVCSLTWIKNGRYLLIGTAIDTMAQALVAAQGGSPTDVVTNEPSADQILRDKETNLFPIYLYDQCYQSNNKVGNSEFLDQLKVVDGAQAVGSGESASTLEIGDATDENSYQVVATLQSQSESSHNLRLCVIGSVMNEIFVDYSVQQPGNDGLPDQFQMIPYIQALDSPLNMIVVGHSHSENVKLFKIETGPNMATTTVSIHRPPDGRELLLKNDCGAGSMKGFSFLLHNSLSNTNSPVAFMVDFYGGLSFRSIIVSGDQSKQIKYPAAELNYSYDINNEGQQQYQNTDINDNDDITNMLTNFNTTVQPQSGTEQQSQTVTTNSAVTGSNLFNTSASNVSNLKSLFDKPVTVPAPSSSVPKSVGQQSLFSAPVHAGPISSSLFGKKIETITQTQTSEQSTQIEKYTEKYSFLTIPKLRKLFSSIDNQLSGLETNLENLSSTMEQSDKSSSIDSKLVEYEVKQEETQRVIGRLRQDADRTKDIDDLVIEISDNLVTGKVSNERINLLRERVYHLEETASILERELLGDTVTNRDNYSPSNYDNQSMNQNQIFNQDINLNFDSNFKSLSGTSGSPQIQTQQLPQQLEIESGRFLAGNEENQSFLDEVFEELENGGDASNLSAVFNSPKNNTVGAVAFNNYTNSKSLSVSDDIDWQNISTPDNLTSAHSQGFSDDSDHVNNSVGVISNDSNNNSNSLINNFNVIENLDDIKNIDKISNPLKIDKSHQSQCQSNDSESDISSENFLDLEQSYFGSRLHQELMAETSGPATIISGSNLNNTSAPEMYVIGGIAASSRDSKQTNTFNEQSVSVTSQNKFNLNQDSVTFSPFGNGSPSFRNQKIHQNTNNIKKSTQASKYTHGLADESLLDIFGVDVSTKKGGLASHMNKMNPQYQQDYHSDSCDDDNNDNQDSDDHDHSATENQELLSNQNQILADELHRQLQIHIALKKHTNQDHDLYSEADEDDLGPQSSQLLLKKYYDSSSSKTQSNLNLDNNFKIDSTSGASVDASGQKTPDFGNSPSTQNNNHSKGTTTGSIVGGGSPLENAKTQGATGGGLFGSTSSSISTGGLFGNTNANVNKSSIFGEISDKKDETVTKESDEKKSSQTSESLESKTVTSSLFGTIKESDKSKEKSISKGDKKSEDAQKDASASEKKAEEAKPSEGSATGAATGSSESAATDKKTVTENADESGDEKKTDAKTEAADPGITSTAAASSVPVVDPKVAFLQLVRQKITDIYKIHNPEKLNDANFLETQMQKHVGKEEELYKKVCTKYKVTPETLAVPTVVNVTPVAESKDSDASKTEPKPVATATAPAPASSTTGGLFGTTTAPASGGLFGNTTAATVTLSTDTATATAASTVTPASSDRSTWVSMIREKIINIYKTKNPEKLNDNTFIDKQMTKYSGQEQVLYQKVCSTYQVTPELIPPAPVAQNQIQPAANQTQPVTSQPASTGFFSSPWGIQGAASNAQNTTTTPTLPTLPTTVANQSLNQNQNQNQDRTNWVTMVKEKIINVYKTYNPEKLNDTAFLENQMQKHVGKEQELYQKVCKKYNVAPENLPPPPVSTIVQPQPTGGLFGQTQAPQPQQQQTGGLFGQTVAQTQPQQQSGGLFGQTVTQTQPQQQPQPGGLFGQTQTQPQQQQPQQQSGGLFGQTQPQPAIGGAPWNSAAAPVQQPSQPASGGLFNNNQNLQQNQIQAQNPAIVAQKRQELLQRIYQAKNPQKMGDLPGLVQKHQNDLGSLVSRVAKKYQINEATMWRDFLGIEDPAAGGQTGGFGMQSGGLGGGGGGLFGQQQQTQQVQQAQGGMFGNTITNQQQQPQQSGGGLFGTQQQQQPLQQSGGGLFGAQQQQQSQQSGGLFGSQPQQQTGGGLFGQQQQQQPQQTGGGLFGQQQQQQPQQSGGGLFGQQQQQQPQQAGGGLFGQQQQPQQSGGGLFGQQQQQQQPQQGGGGLFGQQQQQPQQGGGLFGAQQQQPQQGGGLFGGAPQQQQQGGGLFGGAAQQQQLQQPQQQGGGLFSGMTQTQSQGQNTVTQQQQPGTFGGGFPTLNAFSTPQNFGGGGWRNPNSLT